MGPSEEDVWTQRWARALDTELSLARLEILELREPPRTHFVRWWDRQGRWGLAERTSRDDPWQTGASPGDARPGELADGALALVRDHLGPGLEGSTTLGALARQLDRIAGWRFTRAAILDAAGDLERRCGRPDLWARWPGERLARVGLGLVLGPLDPAVAVDRVAWAVVEGYRRVTLEVTPGTRLEPLMAIRESFPDLMLGINAQGSCGEHDLPFVLALADLEPAVLEQPFTPTRFDLVTELKEHAPSLPIGLDASICDLGTLDAAFRLGIVDEVRLDPGRLGGPLETWRVLYYCRLHGVPSRLGVVTRSAVGSAAALRVAARLPVAAHDLTPACAADPTALADFQVVPDRDGDVEVDEAPVEIDAAFERRLTPLVVVDI